jgi:hypothetical protein
MTRAEAPPPPLGGLTLFPALPYALVLFAPPANTYPEWLREQARRRHSNQAHSVRAQVLLSARYTGRDKTSADRPVFEVSLPSPLEP